MPSTLSTPRDPRYAAEKARGFALYDADRAAGRMVSVDREGSARAFAQLATALPDRSDTPLRTVAVPKPRRLAPVRSCLTPEALTTAVFAVAGGR